jgi:hypothetical protein
MAYKIARPNVNNLLQQINLGMRTNAYEETFIETQRLHDLFNEDDVERAVDELECEDFERACLANVISQEYRQVFAILIWIGHEDEVVGFRRHRFTDRRLPLDDKFSQEVFTGSLEAAGAFISSQWSFIPHHFSATSGTYCHQSISPTQRILPVMKEVKGEKRGEFGEIAEIIIPTSSQNLLRSQVRLIRSSGNW